jgi:hypothetical protein
MLWRIPSAAIVARIVSSTLRASWNPEIGRACSRQHQRLALLFVPSQINRKYVEDSACPLGRAARPGFDALAVRRLPAPLDLSAAPQQTKMAGPRSAVCPSEYSLDMAVSALARKSSGRTCAHWHAAVVAHHADKKLAQLVRESGARSRANAGKSLRCRASRRSGCGIGRQRRPVLPPMTPVAVSTRKSLAHSVLDRYASLLVNVVSSMALARLLTPADVGRGSRGDAPEFHGHGKPGSVALAWRGLGTVFRSSLANAAITLVAIGVGAHSGLLAVGVAVTASGLLSVLIWLVAASGTVRFGWAWLARASVPNLWLSCASAVAPATAVALWGIAPASPLPSLALGGVGALLGFIAAVKLMRHPFSIELDKIGAAVTRRLPRLKGGADA